MLKHIWLATRDEDGVQKHRAFWAETAARSWARRARVWNVQMILLEG